MFRRVSLRAFAFLQAMLLLATLLLPALASAATWTDQPDYSPGSVVTVGGDNSDGAGYVPGETIDVSVSGPNGYVSNCQGVADAAGTWSCQVTLSSDASALGTYTYIATGETSGVSAAGTFSDNINVTIGTAAIGWLNANSLSTLVSGKYTCNTSGSPNCNSASVVVEVRDSDNSNGSAGGTLRYTSAAIALAGGVNNVNWPSAATVAPSGLADGLYDLNAVLTIVSGTGAGTQTTFAADNFFGLDTVPPTSTIDSVAAGSLPSASGSATDPGVPNKVSGFDNSDSPKPIHVELRTSPGNALVVGSGQNLSLTGLGGTKQTGSWSYTYAGTALAPGNYCVVSSANDHAGNAQATATTSCFTVASATASTSTSAAGASATWGDASVTLNATVQPASGPAVNTGSVTFTVNGVSVTDNTVVAGAASASLSLSGFGAGSYPISAVYNAGAGFTGSDNAGQSPTPQLTVSQADAVCTVTPYTSATTTYDADEHTATGSCIGVEGEDLTAGLNLSSTTHTNAGTYNTDSWSFSGGTNYNDQGPVTITDSIAKADAVCTVTPYTSATTTYDADEHTATGSCIGVEGEDLTAGLNLSSTTHTNAGTYNTDSWSFSGGTNYNDQGPVTITDSIAKADAVCTVTGYTVTYDHLSHIATGSCSGVDAGDAAAGGSLNLAPTTHTAPGSYTDTWTFTGGMNYNDQSHTVIDQIQYATTGLCNGSAGHQILQPINWDGSSVFKQGSTVPAKFRVCDSAGTSVGDPGVVQSFKYTVYNGTDSTSVNETVDSTTPDTAFRWDATDKQWIFNINTKSLAKGKSYLYEVKLNDGTSIFFGFGLR